jgi:nucleoid-associated protein Lsr2
MAQKIQTLFIDDIDGGAAEGTVRFGLDGTEYEIDLSASHAEELRKVLSDYAAHGRKAGGTTRRVPRGRRANNGAVDTAKVREWAKGNGYDIKERGRVPANVVEKYKAAVSA